MKKNYYSLFAAATMLMAATSCSQEENFAPSSSDMTVFSVQLEGTTQSRAFGDGTTVDKLYYEAYEGDATTDATPIVNGEIDLTQSGAIDANGVIKVPMTLLKGKNYDIIFWAQDTESIYSHDKLTNISLDYTSDKAYTNNESNDAFFASIDNFASANNSVTEVILTRPFAQLNIGTADWSAASALHADGIPATGAKVTVTGLATSFNAFEGTASGSEEQTFKIGAFIDGETFNVNSTTYKNLAMNYLLFEETQALVKVTTVIEKNSVEMVSFEVPNVPVQRNYRTNIYGNILTDANNFNVTLAPGFNGTTNISAELALAAKYGGTVMLTGEASFNEVLDVVEDMTICLNGFTLKYEGTDIMMRVGNGATVTIIDEPTGRSASEGIIEAKGYIASVNEGGTLIIEGGKFKSEDATLFQANGGKIYVYGGYFCKVADYEGKNFQFNHIDSMGEVGLIEITGGTFEGFNPAAPQTEPAEWNETHTNGFLPAGYAAVAEGENYVVVIDASTYADSANKLAELLGEDGPSNIYLAPNATFEGTFNIVNRNVTITSFKANEKATIKGRVNVSNNANASFNNIKFAINDASKHKNTFSGAPYQYPGIVVAYGAAMSFEGCEFETSIATGVCGINAGNHADSSDILTVNNCIFTGDFYAIRTRTLFNITNNIFDIYTNQGTLAAVWTWGNANSGATQVTFTGNTNANTNKVYSVQMTASNFVYDYVTINVQENTNFHALTDGVNPVRFNGTHTFAEGSETF